MISNSHRLRAISTHIPIVRRLKHPYSATENNIFHQVTSLDGRSGFVIFFITLNRQGDKRRVADILSVSEVESEKNWGTMGKKTAEQNHRHPLFLGMRIENWLHQMIRSRNMFYTYHVNPCNVIDSNQIQLNQIQLPKLSNRITST